TTTSTWRRAFSTRLAMYLSSLYAGMMATRRAAETRNVATSGAGDERLGSNACPSTNRPPPCPPHPFRRGAVCYAPAGLGSSQCSARERVRAFPLPLYRTADHPRATFLPWGRTVRGTLT